ncbi:GLYCOSYLTRANSFERASE [Salix koriyanagi]|uniref:GLYCOSYLTRANSFERASE n=1 Tax=Salix koriyanagi TaxID=2511006 RepID=A0A9Q0TQN1_9ROSI|nr:GLYCOSYLTRANSFERASE [Salix koriyanagi]
MSRNGHTITTTRIHIMALDGIVNVNSLFTLALFLGLSWYPTAPDPTATLVTDTSCAASSSIAEDLIAFHVYSFSSFLFSSLIASAVKQTIKRFDNHKDDDSVGSVRSAPLAHVNLAALRAGTLVSGFGSVFGCGFLMMALMDLVQIKLGVLGCGSLHTFAAVIPLVILVPSALGVGSDKGVKFVILHYSNESRKSMQKENQPINLLSFPSAWNHLSFPSKLPSKYLKIALFVKKWPHRSLAGGLERHALTLHLALAKRGHELHIFTTSPSNSSFPRYPMSNLYFHLSKPTAAGYLDQAFVWKQFQTQNSTGKAFDIVHTESVGLLHTRSRNLINLAVSWHGIAYETIHTDIIQELLRNPDEQQSYALTERITKVVEEVRFFPHYAHHVATSDHAGDILRRIYMIPEERVHVILNGVDEDIFKPDPAKGEAFKQKFGVSKSRSLVIGMAGRLVKDKGHPLMFEALRQMFVENGTFRQNTIVLIAGDGPWGARYRDLGANTLVLGPLEQAQLASFYNAIDIFVNPTLRAQGLDHTLLEAMLSGKSVMSTRVASITGSVIVSTEIGYTFSPVVASLKNALYRVWEDGRRVLELKGQASRQRGLQLFTATKMTAAYERLFLCISNDNSKREDYCQYQSPFN